jgi:hypothetical protein
MAAVLALTACNLLTGGDDEDADITGTYTGRIDGDSVTLTVTAGGWTLTVPDKNVTVTGTYTMDGNTATLRSEPGPITINGTAVLKGDTLTVTLYDDSGSETFTFTKGGGDPGGKDDDDDDDITGTYTGWIDDPAVLTVTAGGWTLAVTGKSDQTGTYTMDGKTATLRSGTGATIGTAVLVKSDALKVTLTAASGYPARNYTFTKSSGPVSPDDDDESTLTGEINGDPAALTVTDDGWTLAVTGKGSLTGTYTLDGDTATLLNGTGTIIGTAVSNDDSTVTVTLNAASGYPGTYTFTGQTPSDVENESGGKGNGGGEGETEGTPIADGNGGGEGETDGPGIEPEPEGPVAGGEDGDGGGNYGDGGGNYGGGGGNYGGGGGTEGKDPSIEDGNGGGNYGEEGPGIEPVPEDHVAGGEDGDGGGNYGEGPGGEIARGSTGECAWVLTADSGNFTLTISGNGAMKYDNVDPPWDNYRNSIKTIVIEDGVTAISDPAFGGYTGLTTLTIGNSVETIGYGAISKCFRLTTLIIPDSVKTIGKFAFGGCSGLTTLTIGNSVKTIGDSAFRDCSGLTTLTIPNSVETIGEWAFDGCTGLTEVTNLNPTPQSIDYSVFENVDFKNITLKVPSGSVAAYKKADAWKDFKTIEGIK